MDAVQYVNNVGKIVNDSNKMSIKIDKESMKNIILYDHLSKLKIKALQNNEPLSTLDIITKYSNCIKKEMKIFPKTIIADDCILTETDELIIQE